MSGIDMKGLAAELEHIAARLEAAEQVAKRGADADAIAFPPADSNRSAHSNAYQVGCLRAETAISARALRSVLAHYLAPTKTAKRRRVA